MAYRMGCQAADVVSSIVAIEGAPPPVPTYGCVPSRPVSLLHIHGTRDRTVRYAGTTTYDGAVASVQRYLSFNACSETAMPHSALQLNWSDRDDPESGVHAVLDISSAVSGPDTEEYRVACLDEEGRASEVVLWKVIGEDHSPSFNRAYDQLVAQWLVAQASHNPPSLPLPSPPPPLPLTPQQAPQPLTPPGPPPPLLLSPSPSSHTGGCTAAVDTSCTLAEQHRGRRCACQFTWREGCAAPSGVQLACT